MVGLQGGSECAWAVAGLVAGFAGAFFVATPAGAAVFAAGFITTSVGLKSCN